MEPSNMEVCPKGLPSKSVALPTAAPELGPSEDIAIICECDLLSRELTRSQKTSLPFHCSHPFPHSATSCHLLQALLSLVSMSEADLNMGIYFLVTSKRGAPERDQRYSIRQERPGNSARRLSGDFPALTGSLRGAGLLWFVLPASGNHVGSSSLLTLSH